MTVLKMVRTYLIDYSQFMKKIYFVSLLIFSALVQSVAQSTITIGKGNVKGVMVSASSNSNSGIQTLMSTGLIPNAKAASRFLSQATFGPKLSDIQALQVSGIEPWLNSQLSMPYTFGLTGYVGGIHKMMVDSLNFKNNTTTNTIANLFISDLTFDIAWFQGAMTSADQLRWRIGFALSQVFVTSRVSAFSDNPYALASYYDVLNRNAFGNYRAILDSITYHPSMGVYLTFMNNKATDPLSTVKAFPDENYAREVMQLFSIGLYELNQDGTEKKDASGKLIPTYTNDDIQGLAKVFTGLSWWDSPYFGVREKNKWSYTRKMKYYGVDSTDKIKNPGKTNPKIMNAHEPGSKTFLGYTIPARPVAQGNQDIQDALNILYNHPNVGPFMAIRLIQQLVTSNPSKEYISRVAGVFNNNGSGVRGDMKAMIKAILLDPEARDCCSEKTDKSFGHFREPFLRYMNVVKGLNLTAANGVYRNMMNSLYDKLSQKPMNSPSVFNFYSPVYVPDGPLNDIGKVGPEFQTLNSLSFSNYMNGLHQWLMTNDPVEYWTLFSGETKINDQDPTFNLTADYPLAADSRLTEVLDKYNLVLAQGKVSKQNIKIIENAVKQLPIVYNGAAVDPDYADRRLRMAIFLIMISPDYIINR